MSTLPTLPVRCTLLVENFVRILEKPCHRNTTLMAITEVGSCSCVGLVGATLGGGIGAYGGLHGLMIDALVSVRMVAGNGEILTVSATEHPDLFWGLRGAGFNYGIITNATWKIYPFTNNGRAMSADMRFAISKNASIWEYVASYSNNQPDQLTLDLGIAYDKRFGGVSEASCQP